MPVCAHAQRCDGHDSGMIRQSSRQHRLRLNGFACGVGPDTGKTGGAWTLLLLGRMPAAGQDLSGAGQMREVLPLVPQATSKQKDGPECHQAPSVEIKACAPGAQL